tara:strand:- start:314 stop:982 length:669 start_codon:yes stop_codon:yes gene_type:complete
MSQFAIVANEVKKSFTKTKVLRGVSFSLRKGEQYVIKGASGSGKSTLLYLLGGLDKPDSGIISIGNENINDLNDEELARFRNNKIGFVFQFHFLLSSMTCLENILLPLSLSQNKNQSKVQSFVRDVANLLGVEDCLGKMPYQLSGGQQQRINLIRAVSLHPEYLFCDEPTGSLDSVNTEIVCDFLFRLSDQLGLTLVTVTHDKNVASRFSNHLEMKDGQLTQ